MKISLTICLLYIFIFAFVSCKTKENKKIENLKLAMISADTAFSNMSERVGMKKAFLEYMDDEGILLRPNYMPIVGADAIDFLSQLDDSTFTLTWEPRGGDVSISGDMGYTYGIYKLKQVDTTLAGTYVSIWKKNEDGKWKWVLDTGNEGLPSGNNE